jgi:hypothetical protein
MIETPVRPIAISPTRAFQRCNRSYRYGYVDNLRPIHLSAPIRMGIEAHKFFEDAETMGDAEALALVDQRWEALTADQRAIYQNRGKGDKTLPPLPDDLRRIIRSYRFQYQDDSWDVVGVEHKLDVVIDGKRHVGIMDLLVRDEQFGPGLTLIDRKTTGRIPDDSVQLNDPQLAFYAGLWNHQNAEQVEQVVFDYIVTKAPTTPALVGLKDKPRTDGTFAEGKGPRISSRAIETTVFEYIDAVENAGLIHPEININSHYKHIEQLNSKPSPFFRRRVIRMTPHIIQSAMQDVRATNSFINAATQAGVFPRSVGPFTCPSCQFKGICGAELQGDEDMVQEELLRFEKSDYWDRYHASA